MRAAFDTITIDDYHMLITAGFYRISTFFDCRRKERAF